MKALAALALSALMLGGSGCIVVPRRPPLYLPAAHVHSPSCGHFWGYYGAAPVYYAGGQYTYWNGASWIALTTPPVHRHHRHHRGKPVVVVPPAPGPVYHPAVPP